MIFTISILYPHYNVMSWKCQIHYLTESLLFMLLNWKENDILDILWDETKNRKGSSYAKI